MVKLNIAIIGAGLSGLSLAEELKAHANITVFEKARGVGGRMSTRYTEDFQFDHGAQFFTARSRRFQKFLKPFIDQNIVQEWTPKVVMLEVGEKSYKRDWFEPHYTATPTMNMLCKAIAEKHDVRIKTQIETLTQTQQGWFLKEANGAQYGPFSWVVSTAPAPQTARLLPQSFSQYKAITDTQMKGCYSLMIGFADDLKLNWSAAKINNSPIGWMAVNSSKPSQKGGYCLLAQTTNAWADAHIDDDQDGVRDDLTQVVGRLLGRPVEDAAYLSLHRWRYASTVVDEDSEYNGYLIDEAHKLAACGDWCVQGTVESAHLSAVSLAGVLKDNLTLHELQ
jgi:renalase